MKTFRILHLACYSYNVGDSANIDGIRTNLTKHLKGPVEFYDEDMIAYPEFLNKKNYDDSFVDKANSFDALLIGGGNFFAGLDFENSTGCYIGLSEALLDKIQVPLIFSAIGFSCYYGKQYRSKSKFKRYLSYLCGRPNTLIGLRNDGSYSRLTKEFHDLDLRCIERSVDGGFLCNVDTHSQPLLPSGRPVVAIQLAGDKAPFRFCDRRHIVYRLVRRFYRVEPALCNERKFENAMVQLINELYKSHDCRFVFVPHIPIDLEPISKIVRLLGPGIGRRYSAIGPVVTGMNGAKKLLGIYQHVDLVLGMRFHSNVCPIGFSTPTVGIDTHPQLPGLYEELEMTERCVSIRNQNLGEALYTLVTGSLEKKAEIVDKYRTIRVNVEKKMDAFHSKAARLIEDNT